MDTNIIKAEIYEHILNGTVSESVLQKLFRKDGTIIPKECELWDYKKTFDESDDAYLKTLKSIISFYNTYGGYIIYGIDEEVKDSKFVPLGISPGMLNQQKVRSKFDRFFGHRLDLSYEEIEITVNAKTLILGLLHIPKRPCSTHSIAPICNGQTSKGNKQILSKDAVYFRKSDECKQVMTHQDFEFIASERDFKSIQKNIVSNRKPIIEHNLPDKNYICPVFIGRFGIIQELWSWLSDEFQYAKVLAADGGKGKTSIAYEFCQLLARSGTQLVEQIIWLTAKKKQFKSIDNAYMSSPETHYYDLDSLLREICLRTGSLESEIEDYSFQQLQRTAKNNLLTYPTFIVIDDVDSNDADEQRRISESARIISNEKSRVLLTTRANNIYSRDSCIEVPGLEGEDYKKLVNTLCEQLKLQKYNETKIKKIHFVSEGSPLFTESILRLCRLGMSVDGAIEEWKGRSGESVREAALRKEVSELSPESIKILLTISYMDSCSRTELHQLTEMDYDQINNSIEELGNLFLLQGLSFIEHEPRFETSSSISNLVLSISEEILPNASEFLGTVKQIAAGLKEIENTKGNIPAVGAAIAQCNALLNANRFDDARETVNCLIYKPNFKENPDLYFMLAKIEYKDPVTNGENVRRLFNEAYIKGQRKSIFFEMWYQAEIKYGSDSSIFDICDSAMKENESTDVLWPERYVEASINKAKILSNFSRKIEVLVHAYEVSISTMTKANSSQWRKLKDFSVEIVDSIWDVSEQYGNYKISTKTIINAIKNGDIRSDNYIRLVSITKSIRRVIKNENVQDYNSYEGFLDELESFIEISIEDLKKKDNKRSHIIGMLESVLYDHAIG